MALNVFVFYLSLHFNFLNKCSENFKSRLNKNKNYQSQYWTVYFIVVVVEKENESTHNCNYGEESFFLYSVNAF